MKVNCTWRLSLAPEASAQSMEKKLDALMEELLLMESAEGHLMDSAVGLDMASRTIEVSITSRAISREICISEARRAVEHALSACAITPATDLELIAV